MTKQPKTKHPSRARVSRAQASGYVRHSKDEQGERMSPALQRRAIEKWAADHDLVVDSWHKDSAPGSAAISKRPGLQEALAALGPDSTMIVYRLDRLARDLELQRRLFRVVAAAGARIVSTMDEGTNNGDADDPDAVFLRGLSGLLAERESGVLGRRIRDGIATKREQGRQWTHHAPYGHRWTPAGHLAQSVSEQRTIKLVHDLRADGFSYRQVLAELQRRRRFNRVGNSFNLAALQKILRK